MRSMELTIDMTGKDVQVTKQPEARLDSQGVQRTQKESGQPLWSVQVVVTDNSGGEVITVNVAGKRPDLAVGDPVELIGLTAIPWHTNGRSGVAYRAAAIELLDEDDEIDPGANFPEP